MIYIGSNQTDALQYCNQTISGLEVESRLDVPNAIPVGTIIETTTFSGSISYYQISYSSASDNTSLNLYKGSVTNLDVCASHQGPIFSNRNYTLVKNYQRALQSSSESKEDMISQVVYYDGLGRPEQYIDIEQSPGGADIVRPVEYDGRGYKKYSYLSYPADSLVGNYRENASNEIENYYYNNYSQDFPSATSSAGINIFSETDFEASPLNKPIKQSAPGETWKMGSGQEIEYKYQVNEANEVRMYRVNFSNGNTELPILAVGTSTYHPAGTLYKTIIKDENHSSGTLHTMEEFKNKMGQVVLKRTYGSSDVNMDGDTLDAGETNSIHDTYFIYDRFGNLSFVLPPKTDSQNGIPNLTELKELVYQYKYDSRNRLIEKKIPGKYWEFIVYNTLDQPILIQDANLDAQNKWLFTKYDGFGRPIITGIFTNSSSRPSLQLVVDNFYANNYTKAWEEKTTSATYNYYTNNSYPTTGAEVLTLNYYDNYTFDATGNGLKLPSGTLIFGKAVSYDVKGLPTGSRIKILDQSTSEWVTTVIHYDDKGRAIYTGSYNDLLLVKETVKNELDFPGDVIGTQTYHRRSSDPSIATTDYFEYDHAKRLTKHTQQINEGAIEVIASNTYDELGQLVEKGVGNVETSVNRLQDIAYSYNIRGWLKQINNPASLGTNLFGFKIGYNEGINPLYNGNIALTQWKTANTDSSLKTYDYTYDALNRITTATDNISRYNLSGMAYDKNGNITNLTRKGHIVANPVSTNSTDFGTMDVLSYNYETNSNKLINVTDAILSIPGDGGFKDGNKSGNDYTYDTNGNLTSDANKGIPTNGIIYNHLNLPTSVTLPGGTISYIYDATGVKQRKVAAGTTTDYAGNYIYQNGSLQFFNHPEGYVEYDGGSFNYIYNYTDHLGNIRLSYINTGTSSSPNVQISKENNYYPFGLTHSGYNGGTNGLGNAAAKKYKFGGKELQDDNISGNSLDWYDFSARNYDPALGRWMNPDPLSDEFPNWSPYTFTNDNPIFFTDPTGLAPETIYENSITGATVEVDDGVDKTIVVDEKGFEKAKKYSKKGEVNKENYTPEEFSEYESFYNNQLYGETSKDRISNILDYLKDGLVEQLLDSGLKNPYQDVAIIEDYGLLSGGGKNVAKGTGKIIKAANGLEINGFVKHGLNRIIQRGVSPGSILDALKNPLKVGEVVIDKLGRQSQRFIGQFGEIVVNPKTGKIISGNPTASKKAARLLKRK
ncbi:DUF6443 domain-containing protein [Gillisia sp. Hel_I_86]|uniref:DUF6443 domain-containing protein n=1 Tax=Gillisia sp. Hel_I_86 TaxID=1249981 RepID=UPI001646C59D|nr:DUF6443 domain-containing protein [Gillisia sp. Hel_I_86]